MPSFGLTFQFLPPRAPWQIVPVGELLTFWQDSYPLSFLVPSGTFSYLMGEEAQG